MNKIISIQAMSSGWNRKERYMLEKKNMMKHMKFLIYWIKTTIPLLTFTITKKEINSTARGQLIMFYMMTKNETITMKKFKEWIIKSMLIQLFKMRKNWNMRRWSCINQTYSSKNNFSPKHIRNISKQQERTSNFNNVPMFSFSNAILLRIICARSSVNDSI